MGSLVQTLFSGPLDIVGDVHGELDALQALLTRLGYRNGEHPHGRRLVFVGDLCDRGPDSPGVVHLVQRLVTVGLAQCVLGNHELNILRQERKHGNHWFYGDFAQRHLEEFGETKGATPEDRHRVARFFAALPVVLERDDVRVVHAAWTDDGVRALRAARVPLLAAYNRYDDLARTSEEGRQLVEAHDEEAARYGEALTNRAVTPPPLRSIAAYDEYYQMSNPIRVVTSGVEGAAEAPFFAAGKWRFVERRRWWLSYSDPVPVVFGHYWRWWDRTKHQELSKGEPNLFDGETPDGWQRNAQGAEVGVCIDYSVGVRFKERKHGRRSAFAGKLAALRWPERDMVFDE